MSLTLSPNYYLANLASNFKLNKLNATSPISGNTGIQTKAGLKNDTFVRSSNIDFISFGSSKKLTPEQIREKLDSGEKVPYKALQENYYALEDVFDKPLTPFDNDDIIARRKDAAKSFNGSVKPEEFGTPAREAFKKDLANRLYNIGIEDRKQERKACIVFGLPGSGKTSGVAEPLAKEMNAMLIDGDITRELEPQYRENAANKYYKEEQKLIEKDVRERAIKNGDNFVHNIVYRDDNPQQLRNILHQLKENGYKDVKLVFVDLPPEEAANRALARLERTNRFMDPLEIYCLGDTPKHIYEQLRNEGEFDGFAMYSNDVPFGTPPELIEKIETTKEEPKFRNTQKGLDLVA